AGMELAQRMLGVPDLYADDPRVMEWPHFLETSLRAKEFYRRDDEYIVKDGQVVIVDPFTGRLMEGRVWGGGVHQAVTVKEGLRLKEESQTVATITYQNFFRLYNKLAGMTGTAATEAAELDKIYKLGVLVIPTNLPLIRLSHPDVVYRTEKEKWKAVVNEIVQTVEEGRPALVGTKTIEQSEHLSKMLLRKGVEHELLNGRPENAARESEIVAVAGQAGAVTLATNMAGRGTDIVLGPGVADRGGLHVVGTQRHEARRIDNQLRGRAGRQGDPGSSRFFVSFEDELLRIFAPESTRNWLKRVGMEEDMALESRMVSRMIQKAQQRVEEYNFDMRKNVLEYDEVMDEQRKTIYSWRQKVLERRKVEEELVALAEESTQDTMDVYVDSRRSSSEWDMEGLAEWFERKHGEPLDIPSETQGRAQELEDHLVGRVRDMFRSRCEAAGKELMVEFGREALLRTIDVRWKDHLRAMDVLRSGISLRAWAQHDPKIEYKSEAGRMFEEMMASIAEHVSDLLFRVHVEERDRSELGGVWQIAVARHDAFDIAAQAEHQREAAHAAGERKRIEPIRVELKVGRNEPCPCGSGKKYKQCCGRTG
ncbi:MAG: SEC-C metal-binding domain-containing protein, partial [Candidatus Brocadiia bacterium]|nr:SEC-C metal-binding domain-containing protein [Candidatus Brocadiia bacterium]